MEYANWLNLCTHYISKLNHIKENSVLIKPPRICRKIFPEQLNSYLLPLHIKRYYLEKRLISINKFMESRSGGETISLDSLLHLLFQPGSRELPIPLDGNPRNTQNIGCLIECHSAKIL